MVQKLSITDLDLKGKKVLMRVDFNVPLSKTGRSQTIPGYKPRCLPSNMSWTTEAL